MDKILDNWGAFLLIVAGLVVAVASLMVFVAIFIAKLRESGIDEIKAGPVSIDFEGKDENEKNV